MRFDVPYDVLNSMCSLLAVNPILMFLEHHHAILQLVAMAFPILWAGTCLTFERMLAERNIRMDNATAFSISSVEHSYYEAWTNETISKRVPSAWPNETGRNVPAAGSVYGAIAAAWPTNAEEGKCGLSAALLAGSMPFAHALCHARWSMCVGPVPEFSSPSTCPAICEYMLNASLPVHDANFTALLNFSDPEPWGPSQECQYDLALGLQRIRNVTINEAVLQSDQPIGLRLPFELPFERSRIVNVQPPSGIAQLNVSLHVWAGCHCDLILPDACCELIPKIVNASSAGADGGLAFLAPGKPYPLGALPAVNDDTGRSLQRPLQCEVLSSSDGFGDTDFSVDCLASLIFAR